ncbi:MAG: hypothetical protein K2O54_05115 [Prevotella sp.]|nr:hypothetical protein [Prevotella sp.]MDE7089479.1 hypothetical protein [Prevotella sp.]
MTQIPNIGPSALLITQESIINGVLRDITIYGIDKARARFDVLDSFHGNEPGWFETRKKVDKIFIDKRTKQSDNQPLIDKQINIFGNNATYNENLKPAY